MPGPPALSRWRGVHDTRCARLVGLHPAGCGRAAQNGHGAGGGWLPPCQRARLCRAQDSLRVRFPAPPVLARGAGRRPGALPRDPEFRRLRGAARDAAQRAGATAGQVALVGRIDAGKGFGEFLAAASGGCRRMPHHGRRRRSRARGAGNAPRRIARAFSRLAGYPRTRALAARSQVCVVPSLCEEACSTTVLEALALGKRCWRWRAAARRNWPATSNTPASCS